DDVRLLAAHIRGAGDQVDPAHALDVLAAATRADLDRRAGEEACASARTGLDLARRLGRRDVVDELAGAYAEACEIAGRVQDALTAWLEAADSAADPRTQARRLTRAAIVAWDLGLFTDAYAFLETADRALAAVAPGPEHVGLEETRVRFAGRAGDFGALDQIIARLAALEQATGSSRPRAVMLLARMGLAIHGGQYADGLRAADTFVPLARDQESMLVGEALRRPLTLLRLCWGDLPGARAAAEEGIRLARQTGVPALEILPSAQPAFVDKLAGEWPAALRRTSDDIDLAQRVGASRGAALALAIQGMLLVHRGDVDEAADRVSDARRLFGRWSGADRHVFALVDLVEGMVALARHDVDRALDIVAGKAAQSPTIPPLALALLGEAQAAAADVAGVRATPPRGWPAWGPGPHTPPPWPLGFLAWRPEPGTIRPAPSTRSTGSTRRSPGSLTSGCPMRRPSPGWTGVRYGPPPATPSTTSRRTSPVHCGYWTGCRPSRRPTVPVPSCVSWADGPRLRPATDRAGSARARRRWRAWSRRACPTPTSLSACSSAPGPSHLQNIYRRLDVPSRAALIRYVLETSPVSDGTSRGGVHM
ncbi:MAG TPA: hypothetical protein VGQ92_04180, partial [Actinoplanes sp.]|nr:hypothetical protein [Actinoplanes sp.]